MSKIIPFPGADETSGASGSDDTDTGDWYRGSSLGLTPEQLAVCLRSDSSDYRELVAVSTDLPPGAVQHTRIIRRVTQLLALCADDSPVRMTDRGYLPRSMVKTLAAQAYREADDGDLVGPRLAHREADLPELVRDRQLAELAGLLQIDQQRRALEITSVGKEIVEQQDWGRCYGLLLQAVLDNPGIFAEFDRIEDDGWLSFMTLLWLHLCREESPDVSGIFVWDLAWVSATVLGDSLDADPVESNLLETLRHVVELRFVQRFALPFGLLTEQDSLSPPAGLLPDNPQQPELFHRRRQLQRYCPTELLTTALHWRTQPPQRILLSDVEGALSMCQLAEQLDQSGYADYRARNLFLQSLARDPQLPEAYLGLAGRQYEPAAAEQIISLGIAACTPPDGAADSNLADLLPMILFRIRMRMIGRRYPEAEQDLRWLSSSGGHAVPGIQQLLFSCVIAQENIDQAELLLEEGFPHDSMEYHWNRVLIAYARGAQPRPGRY